MYEKVCSSHSISTKALKTLVLETIKRTCDYAVENEAEFRETVCSISEEQQGELSVRLEKRLAKKQKRVNEVNRLIKKLYEDNIWTIVNKKDTIFKYIFWERLDSLPLPESCFHFVWCQIA